MLYATTSTNSQKNRNVLQLNIYKAERNFKFLPKWHRKRSEHNGSLRHIFSPLLLIPLNCKLANSSPVKTSLMRYLIIIFIEHLPFKTLLYYKIIFQLFAIQLIYSEIIVLIKKYFNYKNIRQLSNANVPISRKLIVISNYHSKGS